MQLRPEGYTGWHTTIPAQKIGNVCIAAAFAYQCAMADEYTDRLSLRVSRQPDG